MFTWMDVTGLVISTASDFKVATDVCATVTT